MAKYLKIGFVRELESKLNNEEISYSNFIELMETECLKNYKSDNTLRKRIVRVFGEIFKGFKWAEENRHKSGWGKF
jgi:hypothetical protein